MIHTIHLLKSHIRERRRIKYTGRTANATRLAKIYPIYKSFVLAHLDFCKSEWKYTLPRSGNPGYKGPFYARFRDIYLKIALRELRAEYEGLPVDQVPETQYDCREKRFKESATTNRGSQPAPRAIFCWSSMEKEEAAAEALQMLCEW